MQADDELLVRIFKEYRSIACVGFSKDPSKWANIVPSFLISKGYNVIPVNPTTDSILGRRSYPSLSAVPERVDIVQIFRPSEEVPGIVREAIERGDVKVIWMQKGISNEEAARLAESRGMIVVQDRCMYEEYARLLQ